MGAIRVATKAVILYKKKALIVQRADNQYAGRHWEFAGGGLEFGETLHDGLLREVKEETGLDVRVDKLLYVGEWMVSPKTQIIALTYLCHADTDKVILSDEHKAFLWVTLEQMTETVDEAMLNDLISNSVLDMLDID